MELDINKDFPDWLPIVDWSFVKTAKKADELRKIYNISEQYQIIATDELGDIISICEEQVVSINHEETEDVLIVGKNIDLFWEFLFKLKEIPDYDENTFISELREIQKKLKDLKKEAPKEIKNYFTDEIDNLKDLIDDFKFYSSPKGIFFKKTQQIREEFDQFLEKPQKYKTVHLEVNFETNNLYVFGWLTQKDENIEEIKNAIKATKTDLQIEIKPIKSYKEYLNFSEKEQY